MARLLIIDDEKMICQEFCDTLNDLGHQTDFALTAEDALKQICTVHYDLVFMDLSMPRVSGADLFKKIRQVHQVPVVFMTGFISPATEEEVLSLGALRCLRKPVQLAEITGLLENLDRAQSRSH